MDIAMEQQQAPMEDAEQEQDKDSEAIQNNFTKLTKRSNMKRVLLCFNISIFELQYSKYQ